MKKALLFLLIILLLPLSLSVKADDEYEYFLDSQGNYVYYYGTRKKVSLPKYYHEKEREFRGAWVSFYAGDIYASANKSYMMSQLNTILDNLEYFNMNALVFHIRTHNNAYYPTEYAPIDLAMANMKFEEWDYLEWLINECHRRGIEFHAWLNPYRITSSATTVDYIISKYQDYPLNPANDINNVLMSNSGSILDPGVPSVREYIINVCMEVVNKYDIDAIHFDDYFYISGIDDSKTRNKYNTSNLSINAFRTQSVDLLIKGLHEEIKAYNNKNNKAVQLGISPTGIYDNGEYVEPKNYTYNSDGSIKYPLYSGSSGFSHKSSPLYCDTLNWINHEWIDYITPQLYNEIENPIASFASVADWWNGVCKYKKCNLYLGVGLYKRNESSSEWSKNDRELSASLKYAQSLENVSGICIYQYLSLVRYKNQDFMKEIVSSYWTKKPLSPIIKNINNECSAVISDVKYHESDDLIALTWNKIDGCYRYAVFGYNDQLVLDYDHYLGVSGADKNRDFVSITLSKDDTFNNYVVIPLSYSNVFGLSKEVANTNKSIVTDTIGYIEINVGAPDRLGGAMVISFSSPTIYIGDIGVFKIVTSEYSDFREKVEYKTATYSETSSNILRIDYNKTGKKMYVRLECNNSFGTFYSNTEEVSFIDTPITIIDYMLGLERAFYDEIFK